MMNQDPHPEDVEGNLAVGRRDAFERALQRILACESIATAKAIAESALRIVGKEGAAQVEGCGYESCDCRSYCKSPPAGGGEPHAPAPVPCNHSRLVCWNHDKTTGQCQDCAAIVDPAPVAADTLTDEQIWDIWREGQDAPADHPVHTMEFDLWFARAILAATPARAIPAQGAAPVPAEPVDDLSDKALGIIAACRDAFPPPPVGADAERFWAQAISEPESVPDYLRAVAVHGKREPLSEDKIRELGFFACSPLNFARSIESAHGISATQNGEQAKEAQPEASQGKATEVAKAARVEALEEAISAVASRRGTASMFVTSRDAMNHNTVVSECEDAIRRLAAKGDGS